MLGYFFKGFELMALVQSWSEKALKDGKVTLVEATELAVRACEIIGIPLEIDVSKGNDEEE